MEGERGKKGGRKRNRNSYISQVWTHTYMHGRVVARCVWQLRLSLSLYIYIYNCWYIYLFLSLSLSLSLSLLLSLSLHRTSYNA